MNIEYKVSLDNLTVVGVPKYSTSMIRELILRKGVINNFWQTPYKRYNDNYSLLGGGLLQITHDKGFVDSDKFTVHQIRLEFNPNSIIKYKSLITEYLDLLKFICDPKITRKDIAIDLMGVDMNDFIILDYSSRKRIEYKTGSMVLETLYFGSKHSEERHRIYNKALEQGLLSNRSKTDKETGEKVQTTEAQDIKWWRVEAQLRKEKAEMMRYNPFTKIRIVSKQEFLHYDVRTRAMLFYLQANPDAMKELSINVRTKYKKLLGEQIDEWFIDIEGMADEAKDEIQSQIESWLNFAPLEVREGFRVTALESCLKHTEKPFTDEERLKAIETVEEWADENFEEYVSRGTKEEFEKWVNEREKK